jgi:Carboxylesterase family
MKNKIILALVMALICSVQAFAYRTVTLTYNNNLQMDCYIPTAFVGCPNPNDNDPFFYPCGPSNATILVLMHGGFFEFGSRGSMNPYAIGFAQREDMIILNIDYRLGWGYNPSNPCSGNDTNLSKAAYRVVQDVHAAVNYFIQHASDPNVGIANSDRYTWNVFAGGYSAGGVTGMNMHIDQTEWDTYAPYLRASEGPVTKNIGSFIFRGTLAIGGSIPNVAAIKPGTYNVFFHGQLDNVVPYNCGSPINPSCTAYSTTCGGGATFNYIAANNIANAKLYTRIGGGHGSFATTQADVNFVVSKFLSSIGATCFQTGCGTIPGPPFHAGVNCPGLVPQNQDAPVVPFMNGVTEQVSLNYICPMPVRMANPNSGTSTNSLHDFIQSKEVKSMNVYGVDGRLLETTTFTSDDQVMEQLNTRFPNQVLILELTTSEGEVQRFKFILVE